MPDEWRISPSGGDSQANAAVVEAANDSPASAASAAKDENFRISHETTEQDKTQTLNS